MLLFITIVERRLFHFQVFILIVTWIIRQQGRRVVFQPGFGNKLQ